MPALTSPCGTPMPSPDPAPPTVRVRLFASLRDGAGWSERLVVLPVLPDQGPSTPLLLWRLLDLAPPAVANAWPAGVRVAINQRFAAPDTPLQSGDELAFLPPITGG
ncbi:MAG: MoaD/ThiS family protein [Cyanobacteriota bacterium]|nr:MoaD/ThiS family protein [Cyanobacteriota bacterium]